ncbi:MAG TPA: UvrD-helicase domain-containing protein [Symbiobacteriaceae bacterium]
MSHLDHLVRDLNPPQREAVLHRDGPLLVIAGAGTGKTKTAIHRLAGLLAHGVPPEAVMCITFTNKAAKEMRERAVALVGPAAKRVMIRTFHSAAVCLLREYLPRYPQSGRTAAFSIADQSAQLALVKEAIAERGFDLLANKPESFLWRISRYKNEMADPESLLQRAPANGLMDWERVLGLIKQTDRYVNRLTAEIWKRYEEKLRQNNLLDFDDLINLFVHMLLDVPAVRAELQERFRYIQVDEFQDTNGAQLQMVKLLAGARQNVMAVGDDYQSLYSWRSADLRCILEFDRHFPGARPVKLEQNYRSTAAILKAANKLIALNEGQLAKHLFTTVGEGWPIVRQELETDVAEANYVAMEIKKAAAMGRRYSDFAILFRLSILSRPLEEKLREEGIPYQVVGGPKFYDRREVQDCFAYFKVLVNPRDSLSLERVLNAPRRGVGERGYQKVLALAARRDVDLLTALELAVAEGELKEKAAAGALEVAGLFRSASAALAAGKGSAETAGRLIRDSGFLSALEAEDKKKDEQRAEVVRSVLTGLDQYHQRKPQATMADYLERLALADAQDDDKGGAAVRLLTIHASKGLEFPVVFVVGVEQGILPNRRAMDEGNLEEERRLAYVAITRARELLYLTGARIRSERGAFVVTEPSQFVAEAL